MLLHANPVPQERTASERTGGVDCDDANALALRAKVSRQGVHQRTLARSRGSGNTDEDSAAGVGEQLPHDLVGIRLAVLYSRDGASNSSRVTLADPVSNRNSLKG
jgi:hypothetical protein